MDDEKIGELITAVAVIESNQKEYKEQSESFRSSVNDKLDKIWKKLESLPCKQGEEHSKYVDYQLKGLWAIVFTVFISVISVAVLWGGTNKQVQVNTDRWDRILQHQTIEMGSSNAKR